MTHIYIIYLYYILLYIYKNKILNKIQEYIYFFPKEDRPFFTKDTVLLKEYNIFYTY